MIDNRSKVSKVVIDERLFWKYRGALLQAGILMKTIIRKPPTADFPNRLLKEAPQNCSCGADIFCQDRILVQIFRRKVFADHCTQWIVTSVGLNRLA
jgi:hypothetical protein